MFFKKREEKKIYSPVDGRLINIENVNDPVFSTRMMGDGFAVEISDDKFYACADGTISAVFPSLHAYGLKLDNGFEILVHIGLDTVCENGTGFKCHKQLNDEVKAGDLIVEINREYLLEKEYDLTTMVIFTNKDSYKSFTCEYGKEVIGGTGVAATYK